MDPETNTEQPRSNGSYNQAAIKRHAIKVTDQTRLGKFTRVSGQFVIDTEASIEAFVRKLRVETMAFCGSTVPCEEQFLTGEGKKKLVEAFNIWIASEIHRRTKDVRVGRTL